MCNLPETMGEFDINFDAIRKFDISFKKQKFMWSGQDVMPLLNFEKSSWMVQQINLVRVWPTGLLGLKKRLRFVLRQHIKAQFFDNLMTFMVLLNTITLSLDHYGIQPEID